MSDSHIEKGLQGFGSRDLVNKVDVSKRISIAPSFFEVAVPILVN